MQNIPVDPPGTLSAHRAVTIRCHGSSPPLELVQRIRDEHEAMLDALYSALNLEMSAVVGAREMGRNAPDVPYHFRKIREAIALVDPDGYDASL